MNEAIEKAEAEKCFIGIDPEDTLEVEYGGAKFLLGVLPVALWERFDARQMVFFTDATRRAIKQLHEEGKDPEEVIGKTTLLLVATMKDETFKRQLHELRCEAIKYGLRSQKGFRTKRREVPTTLVAAKVDGYECTVLDEKVLDIYRANPDLVDVLWTGLRQLHSLEADAKKA